MTISRTFQKTLCAMSFMFGLQVSADCFAQETPPFPTEPIVQPAPQEVPNVVPDPKIMPQSAENTDPPTDDVPVFPEELKAENQDGEKPPFTPSTNPNEEEKLQGKELPFEPAPPEPEQPTPFPSPGLPRRTTNSLNPNLPHPGFPPYLQTIESEIAEVKTLAYAELDRLRLRGQYTTTLATSNVSRTRQNEINLLRESVATAKNLVASQRLSLVAFLDIQRQCVNAELALSHSTSMRNSILRKAIDTCVIVENKVRAMPAKFVGETAPLFKLSDVELVATQREHWQQLLGQPSPSTVVVTSIPSEPVIIRSRPSGTVYYPRYRRRR